MKCMLKRGVLVLVLLVLISAGSSQSSLNGDFNNDCAVDFKDFLLFSQNFDKLVSSSNNKYDLDNNGYININDFFIFADDYWNTRCVQRSGEDLPFPTRRVILVSEDVYYHDYLNALTSLDLTKCQNILDDSYREYCIDGVNSLKNRQLPEGYRNGLLGFKGYHSTLPLKFIGSGVKPFTSSEYGVFLGEKYIRSNNGEGIIIQKTFDKSYDKSKMIIANFRLPVDSQQILKVYVLDGSTWKSQNVDRFNPERNRIETSDVKLKGTYSFVTSYKNPFTYAIVGESFIHFGRVDASA